MEPESPFRLLFRTWSSSSAGANSRRGFLSGDQNRREIGLFEKAKIFDNHSDLHNRIPTCFISTTEDPIRALKYAIDLAVQGLSGIHIAIIRSNEYRCGKEVAAEVSSVLFDINESLYKTEFLFLFEIAPADIIHVVSLETLEGNGLLNKLKVLDPTTWVDEELPRISTIRRQIHENNEGAWRNANEKTWQERSGRYVAAIAKCFGAGAPHRAIASLIWEHGTHFTPANYEYDGLDLRVRNAIQKSLDKNARSCWCDEWCGELANMEILG